MAVPRWAGRVGGRRLSGVGAVEVRQRLHSRRRNGRWVHRDERQRRPPVSWVPTACLSCALLSPGPIASRSSTPGTRRASPAAAATTTPARACSCRSSTRSSLAEPVKRDGPLHAIPGGFLANMQAVALGLARRGIDEAIAVITDKIVLPEEPGDARGASLSVRPSPTRSVSTAPRRPTSAAASTTPGRNLLGCCAQCRPARRLDPVEGGSVPHGAGRHRSHGPPRRYAGHLLDEHPRPPPT